jgi:hypothetical protein
MITTKGAWLGVNLYMKTESITQKILVYRITVFPARKSFHCANATRKRKKSTKNITGLNIEAKF